MFNLRRFKYYKSNSCSGCYFSIYLYIYLVLLVGLVLVGVQERPRHGPVAHDHHRYYCEQEEEEEEREGLADLGQQRLN